MTHRSGKARTQEAFQNLRTAIQATPYPEYEWFELFIRLVAESDPIRLAVPWPDRDTNPRPMAGTVGAVPWGTFELLPDAIIKQIAAVRGCGEVTFEGDWETLAFYPLPNPKNVKRTKYAPSPSGSKRRPEVNEFYGQASGRQITAELEGHTRKTMLNTAQLIGEKWFGHSNITVALDNVKGAAQMFPRDGSLGAPFYTATATITEKETANDY